MKIFFLISTVIIFSIFGFSQENTKLKTAKLQTEKASNILKTFLSLGSESIPFDLFKKSKAIAVFGEIEKYSGFPSNLAKTITGKGVLIILNENGWGVPTFVSCRGMEMGISFHLIKKDKIGVVFLFMNDKSVEIMKKGNTVEMTNDELALGPIVKGKGAELTIEKASVLYYTFSNTNLSGEELKNTKFGSGFSIKHDETMNKAVYGKKFKLLLPESPTPSPINELEIFRQNVAQNY